MTSKVVGSLLLDYVNRLSSPTDAPPCLNYRTSDPQAVTGALNALRRWRNSEFLGLSLGEDGIAATDIGVLTLAGELLRTRKFQIFFLRIANTNRRYDTAELHLIETHLLRNVPYKTQIILYSFLPSTDVYADWLYTINHTFRMSYLCFDAFFGNITHYGMDKIFESFQHPNCRTKGIEFRRLDAPDQVAEILRRFSEMNHKLQLLRFIDTQNDCTSAQILEDAAITIGQRRLFPEGIHWDRDANGDWLIFDFFIQPRNSTKIKRAIYNDASVPYGRTKLMFIGQERVGKTSTIRKLLMQGFDPNEKSTKGFDLKLVRADGWDEEEGEANYMAEFLQNAISNYKVELEIQSNPPRKQNLEFIPIDAKKDQTDNLEVENLTTKDSNLVETRESKLYVETDAKIEIRATTKPEVKEEEAKRYLSGKEFDVTTVRAEDWETADGGANYMSEILQHATSYDNVELKIQSNLPRKKTSEFIDVGVSKDGNTDNPEVQNMTTINNSLIEIRKPKTDAKTKNSATTKPEVSDEEVKKYCDLVSTGEKKLSFSIWDFAGQKVFYSLHHLFLTDYGCYVLVFDMTKINDPKTREASLEFLKFWLFSKKLHAPNAPVIIVGTHCSQFGFDGQKTVSDIIKDTILDLTHFNEYENGKLCFFPVDNMTDEGIDSLREKIEKVVEEQNYVKDPVPSSFLRVLDKLLEQNREYLRLEKVHEIMGNCGLRKNRFDEALHFLNRRGVLSYFDETSELRSFVVLQPQWLINAITSVVFDRDEYDPPEGDSNLRMAFKRLNQDRLISHDELTNIWTGQGYSAEVQVYFKALMLKASVMCQYKFAGDNDYFIPSLFSAVHASGGSNLLGPNTFTGQFFVIDFSGDYNQKIVGDLRYVRYLPFGLFERLVCLCVEHSSTFEEKLKPEIHRESAILTYGNEFKYELRISENLKNQKLWIKVIMDREREQPLAMKLVKTIYSMISALKERYFSSMDNSSALKERYLSSRNNTSALKERDFSSTDNTSVLAISLLIPSDKGVLAEYENVKERKEKGKKAAFWPHANSEAVIPSEFNFWFNERPNDSLTKPDLVFKRLFEKDEALPSLSSPSMFSWPLPDGLKYHCFLSYKQRAAIDLVGKQYYILANRGFKCWWDMQYRNGDLNLEAMRAGVRDSMAYCLHLSEDIFPTERKAGVTYFVDEEVKMAVELKKPIMLFHHPDTGTQGYWSFGDYIKHAPDVLKPYFDSVQSLHLQRLYYLEEATTEQIVIRLNTILDKLLGEA